MSIKMPYHKIAHEGKDYYLTLSSRGAYIAGKECGFRIQDMPLVKFEIPETVNILYGALIENHPKDASIDLALEIFEELGLSEAMQLAMELLMEYLPKLKIDLGSSEDQTSKTEEIEKKIVGQKKEITGTNS